MRLSLVLWRKKMPNGHIFRGKHRLYFPVTPLLIAEERRRLEIEEKNMFYLRNPYLTVEQDRGHAKALNKRQEFANKLFNPPVNLKPHITLEDRLFHLKVEEAWD